MYYVHVYYYVCVDVLLLVIYYVVSQPWSFDLHTYWS